MHTQHIGVVGAGISGLTCGITLLEAGFAVTILTAESTRYTTSAVAAAIWHPFYQLPDENYRRRASFTLEVLRQQAAERLSGVNICSLTEFFRDDRNPPWWMDMLSPIRHISGVDGKREYEGVFCVDVPVADTSLYLDYLLGIFQAKGGRIEKKLVTSLEVIGEGFDAVVNCTGFGSASLAKDHALKLTRGIILRAKKVHGVTGCSIDDSDPHYPTYVIERRHDLILGGTAHESLASSSFDPELIQGIVHRCQMLVPALRGAEILEMKMGFRPSRPEVRLEIDGRWPKIIHNYGHGGSGFTLSWGCAREVARLCVASLNEIN